MHYTYKPKNVCSTLIDFDINGGTLTNVVYQNGCNGNLKAIGRLVEGMQVEDVISKLKGVRCGSNDTSCSDQLARALESVNGNK